MGSLQKLIDFAVSKEVEAAAFYEYLASTVEKKHVRDTLLDFVKEEKKHQEIFLKLGENAQEGSLGESRAHPVSDMKISDYLVETTFDPKMNYQDILILAMKREEKAYHFYRDLALRMEDQESSDLLMDLAEEEATHKAKLETIYDREILSED